MANEKPIERVTPTAPLFQEAPASFNFPVQFETEDGQLWSSGLTIRANSGPEAVEALLETLRYGAWRCKMHVVKTPAPQPGPGLRQPAAPPEPEPSLDRLPAAPGSPPPERSNPAATTTAAGAPNVIYAVKLEITPKPDGKVTLAWFSAGHRFADITKTCPIGTAVDLLQSTGEDWRTADVSASRVVSPIRHAVAWHDGKPKAQGGGFYKDIDSVSLY